MHYHHQNLNEKPGDRLGSILRYGRAWLRFNDRSQLSCEWNVFYSSSCGIELSVDQGDGVGFSWHIQVPWLFSLYWSVEGFGLVQRFAKWLLRNAGYEDRNVVRLSFHDWTLFWEFWQDPNSWSSKTPRWRNGSFHPLDFLLGKTKYSKRVLSTTETVVPMPEGSYPAVVELDESTWKRPRWFARRLLGATISVEGGVPIPGKGESSWDCGEDATYSLSCRDDVRTVEQAVAKLVESVLTRRRRYGGRNWRPAPRPEEQAAG